MAQSADISVLRWAAAEPASARRSRRGGILGVEEGDLLQVVVTEGPKGRQASWVRRAS